ncbi:MAG: phospholipid carrier-dependent glycosyltransferase [Armatimonadota bacterium]|nr:phospholipid carrier-dependent glycosyltransferase [Armatimonadota bacterium]MDW8155174.1 phospholipid carrier-dependent glycosyltransferase [Armatimonadota bacterium]
MHSMARHPLWWLAALVVASAALRLWRLGEPPTQVFDEIYYARTARQYLLGQPIYEWTHPPLSKLLVAVGIRAMGFEPWGWRLLPALFGTALVPALYALGRLATDRPSVGLAMAALGFLDSIFVVESRIAKPEVFLVTFSVVAYACGWAAVRSGRWGWLAAAGASAGAACATKWTGLASVAVLGFLVWRHLRRRCPWWVLAASLLALPAGVYAASYLPHLARGETIADLVRLHLNMYRYHSTLQATHPYASPWWSWPLLLRPMWYYYQAEGGWMRGVFAVGNPLVWWAVVPAVAAAAWQARRSPALAFAAVGFVLTYVPYAFVGRLLFVYHFTPVLPFGYLALANALDQPRLAGWRTAYWLAAAVVFLYQLPVLTAYPVPATWLRWWAWVRSWV